MNKKEIGKKLKQIRLATKTTQHKFAYLIGTNPTQVSLIEKGERNITLPIFITLADYLNLSLDDLRKKLGMKKEKKK